MNLHNFDKRLGNIEKTLTPQQVVGFLMDKAFKVRATEDYASWRQEDVEGLINRTLTGVIERTRNDGSKFQAHAFARARTELSKLTCCWVGCDRFASGIIGNGLRGIRLLVSEWLRMIELGEKANVIVSAAKNLAGAAHRFDFDDAAAIDQATDNYVANWDSLAEGEMLEWLASDAGAKKCGPLSDDSDEENATKLAALREAMRALSSRGAIDAGVAVVIGTPYEQLDFTPLVEREWIDRHVLELAEFTAALEERGFEFRRDQSHPLSRLTAYERREQDLLLVDDSLLAELRQEARAAIARFPGRTKEIGTRTYLSIRDYHDWSERRVKGDLDVLEGIRVSSWNAWVDANGGEGRALLAGVKVGKLRTNDRSDVRPYSSPEQAHQLQPSHTSLSITQQNGEAGCASKSSDSSGGVSGSSSRHADLLAQTEHVRKIAIELFEDLWAASSVCAIISRDEFSGHAMLPDEDLDVLRDLLRETTEIIHSHNNFIDRVFYLRQADLTRSGEKKLSIDLTERKIEAEKRSQSVVAWLRKL
jgi:hypothetical protein